MTDAAHQLTSIVLDACWGSFVLVWVVAALYFKVGRGALRGGFIGYWFAAIVFLAGLDLVLPAGVWAALHTSSEVAAVAGAALVVAATAFAIWARLVLGAMWSSAPRVREDHQLATGGPYRITRHPIYTGILGMLAGTALCSGGGRSLLVLVGGLVFVQARISVEEALMLKSFGAAYETFCASVPKLVPSPRRLLSRRRSPVED